MTDVPTDVYIAVPAGVAIALISMIGWYFYRRKDKNDKSEPPLPPPSA